MDQEKSAETERIAPTVEKDSSWPDIWTDIIAENAILL
jgi:hypothetical protein